MATITLQRYCPTCGQHRPFAKEGAPNGVFVIVLALTTIFFFWTFVLPIAVLAIWALFVFSNAFEPFRCAACGKSSVL